MTKWEDIKRKPVEIKKEEESGIDWLYEANLIRKTIKSKTKGAPWDVISYPFRKYYVSNVTKSLL